MCMRVCFVFFKQKTAYEMRISDWSSDVCSSDLQSKSTDELLLSYREQFSVGRRSLLDVLDAQNTRFNVQVRAETARFSEMFAVYQVLASTNNLLDAFDLTATESRRVYAREEDGYGPPAPADPQRRRYPQSSPVDGFPQKKIYMIHGKTHIERIERKTTGE